MSVAQKQPSAVNQPLLVKGIDITFIQPLIGTQFYNYSVHYLIIKPRSIGIIQYYQKVVKQSLATACTAQYSL